MWLLSLEQLVSRTLPAYAVATLLALYSGVAAAGVQHTGLNGLWAQAESNAPTITKAKNEVVSAEAGLVEAKASLGWILNVSTPKTNTATLKNDGTLAADLRLKTEVTHILSPGNSLVFTADQLELGLQNSKTDLQMGLLTLGWLLRYPAESQLAEVKLVSDRARTLIQKQIALELAHENAHTAIAKAYFDYWRVQLDLQVAQKQLDAYMLQLQRSKALAQVGRAVVLDVTIAEQRVKLAQLSVSAYTTQVDTAIRDLARQMGVERSELNVGEWSEPNWQLPSVGEIDTWLSKAKDRPEIRQAELSVAAAEQQVAAAQLTSAYEIQPQLSFDTTNQKWALGLNANKVKDSGGGSVSASVHAQQGGEWTVNTSFAITLGGASAVQEQALVLSSAKADLRTALTNLTQTKEDASDKLRSLWTDLQLKTAQNELQIAVQEREQINLQTVQTRTELGAATPMELADAQVSYAKAEADAKKARFDQQLAYIKLLAAAGDREALTRLEGW